MGFRASNASNAPLVRLSHLRRLRACEQVAAICYRIHRGEVQFLLVQTRGRRWTFPKGGVEPGLTHAQAAALEAFEEAGVHGRIEETAFTQYFRTAVRPARSSKSQAQVSAHLCEVHRLTPPQEADRNRTWFTAEKTKSRLSEGRTRADSKQFSRLVDRAVARIELLRNTAAATPLSVHESPVDFPQTRDSLQRVQFEAQPAFPGGMEHAAALARSMYGRHGAAAIAVNTLLCDAVPLDETLQLGPGEDSPDWHARSQPTPAKKARVVEIAGRGQLARRFRLSRNDA